MAVSNSIVVNLFIRVAVFALLGSGIAAWTKVKNSWRARSSRDWPTTDATIHSGSVQKIPQSTNYKVQLSYSYFIDEYRSGTYDRTFITEFESDTFVRRLKNVRIPARYSPSNPDKSFLEEVEIGRVLERAVLVERMKSLQLPEDA